MDAPIYLPNVAYLRLVCGPALRTEVAWGVPAPVTIAQAIIEGNGQVDGKWVYGSSRLVRLANNPFGIKATHVVGEDYAEHAMTVETPEVGADGHKHILLQDFRVFPSLDAAFDAHAQLLKFSPRYALAMQVASDWRAFAVAIMVGGYSTDRPELCRKVGCTHYAGAIETLVNQWKLADRAFVLANYAGTTGAPK